MSGALRALSRSIAASGLALAFACATGQRPASPLPSGDPRPAALLAAIAQDAATRHSLRGVAKLAIDAPSGSGRAKQILALERPARLHIEVLGLLDQTLAMLSTDGDRYRLVRSGDRSVRQGAVYDALLADVAGLAVTPEQAVRVLLGAPLDDGAHVERAAQLPDGALRLTLRRDDRLESEEVDCDASGRVRRWAQFGVDGDALLEATFGDPRPLGDVEFAYEIELRDPRTGASVRVAWSQVELNPALPASLFEVPEPTQ